MPSPAAATVAESRASVVRVMVPTDANFMGNVFGGVILSEVDRVAYVSARRHSQTECVTASFDRVDFIAPVHVGDVVVFTSQVNYVGHSSMEVGVEVLAETLAGGPRRLVGNALVTMVAIDGDGRPTPVRPLVVAEGEEKSRFEAAEGRMRERQRLRPRSPR